MTVTSESVYYDPYDFDIDTDPYPVWKRIRDAAPLYYNEKYDFFALSRSRSSRRTSRYRRGASFSRIHPSMICTAGSCRGCSPPGG
jgi:hypothetical protein